MVTVIDGRVRALRIICPLEQFKRTSWADFEEHYNYYEGIVKRIRETWPDTTNNVFQFSRAVWTGREVTNVMVSNTLAGMICSLCFAFFVLLAVT